MRIVITYKNGGNTEYEELIKTAFASAKRLGYETVLVSDIELDCADIVLPFDASNEEYLMNWIVAAQLHYLKSSLFSCNSVFFSPDAIITKDLKPVFLNSFDIAFTDRLNRRYPINNGVIYIKHSDKKPNIISLWQKALDICKSYDIDLQKWYGDQKCLHDLYLTNAPQNLGVKISLLPCAIYNATPLTEDFQPLLMRGVYVLHFKGKRKHLMNQYWEALKNAR